MYVFSPAFLDPIDKAGIRIINLHPAMPGPFPFLSLSEKISLLLI